MQKVVIHNCIVELTLSVAHSAELNQDLAGARGKFKILPAECVHDVVLRIKGSGGKPDKVLTIKKAMLEMRGEMLPVLGEDGDTVILFKLEDAVPEQPPAPEPIVVEAR